MEIVPLNQCFYLYDPIDISTLMHLTASTVPYVVLMLENLTFEK